jgi:hypothetical protein
MIANAVSQQNISFRVVLGVDTIGLDEHSKSEPIWTFPPNCSSEDIRTSTSTLVHNQFRKAFANVKHKGELWKRAVYRSFIGLDRNLTNKAIEQSRFKPVDGAPISKFVEHFGSSSFFLIVILGLVQTQNHKGKDGHKYFESLEKACLALFGEDYKVEKNNTCTGKAVAAAQRESPPQFSPSNLSAQGVSARELNSDLADTENDEESKDDNDKDDDYHDHESLYRDDTPQRPSHKPSGRSNELDSFTPVFVGQVKRSIYREETQPAPLNAVVLKRRVDKVYHFWLAWCTFDDRGTVLPKPKYGAPRYGRVKVADIDFRGEFEICNRLDADRTKILANIERILKQGKSKGR